MSCPVIDPALVEVLRTFLKDYVIIKKQEYEDLLSIKNQPVSL
jgi:hypothetical protein